MVDIYMVNILCCIYVFVLNVCVGSIVLYYMSTLDVHDRAKVHDLQNNHF